MNNRNTHNSISINQSTPEVSHKDSVTSTESRTTLDGEPTTTINTTYASFYWLFNYIKLCTSRLTNDLYTSFMTYWYPDGMFLPPHIMDLMQVQSRLRLERESHTVTYNRERLGVHSSPLSMRKLFNAFKSYVLSSEDETRIHYTPKDHNHLSDREPMFVFVDSSCVSNPSSKELLIDDKFHARETVVKRHINKNVKPVDIPSTSRDLENYLPPPLLKESDSTDEMQIVDINLQSENKLSIGDSDIDNDSIVISYLKNKDAFLDLEALSNGSLDVLIPSFPSSPRPYDQTSTKASTSAHNSIFAPEKKTGYKPAIEFLHHDNAFLIAAEMGDVKMLRMLMGLEETNIHDMDHLSRNALHLAVCSGNPQAVDLLLKAGVNPNAKDNLGMTPLSLCLMRSPTWRMATLLLDHGALLVHRASPLDTGLFLQFVMMCTPTKEEERILHLLVEKGALVNDPEAPGGRQALHFAAMSNNTHLINILVDMGANLFAVNHRNETPKQVAAIFRCKEAYALLQEFEEVYSYIEGSGNTAR